MEVDGIEAVSARQSTDGKINIQDLIKDNIKIIKANPIQYNELY
jgi:hypothetical protein